MECSGVGDTCSLQLTFPEDLGSIPIQLQFFFFKLLYIISHSVCRFAATDAESKLFFSMYHLIKVAETTQLDKRGHLEINRKENTVRVGNMGVNEQTVCADNALTKCRK